MKALQSISIVMLLWYGLAREMENVEIEDMTLKMSGQDRKRGK